MKCRLLLVVAVFATACARGSTTGSESDVGPTAVDSSSGETTLDGGDDTMLSGDSASSFDILAESSADASDGGACSTPEICGDGLDNNCDGVIDDGCNCQPGRVSSCYRGPVASRGKGQCADGTMTCVGSGEFGKWGPCTGDVLPAAEVCDPGGMDENCNGTPNEGCECSAGAPPVECGSSTVGACKKGTQLCVDGKLGPCTGAVEPKIEECNNIDDDCDGKVDEDLVRSCGSSTGACKPGAQTCAAGEWGVCTGGVTPSDEKCNNVDDNCNGMTDEGVTGPCGSSVGECKPGIATCTAGVFGACAGEKVATAELCDGLDNNCNGAVDEMCACKSGDVRSCGSNVGECKLGVETCSLAGAWGPCTGGTGPKPETCNMKDDNCNGSVDEGDVCPKFPPIVSCAAGVSATTGTAVTLTSSGSDPDGGSVTYSWSVVVAPVGSSAMPATPTTASTAFTADVAGSYTLRFCVTDDELTKTCCTVVVDAKSACVPPTAPTLASCGTSWDRRPILQFGGAMPAGLTYEVFKDGATPTSLAKITTVGDTYYRPATPVSAGAALPGESVGFFVKACKTDDTTCCANSGVATARLVEACDTAIPATASNIVFSEYVTNGDGGSQEGEAIEITNLSNCPVSLSGNHFSYCNSSCAAGSIRYMNFGAAEVIPPRGVYVAYRDGGTCGASMPSPSAGLFGLKISGLAMQGMNLGSGWFENAGGGSSKMRIASGGFVDMAAGSTLALVAPYVGSPMSPAQKCDGIGFDATAVNSCGDLSAGGTPSTRLKPNQLGRLWHPCDSVGGAMPACSKP